MHYGISKKTTYSFEEAIERVTKLLSNEGLGVLTQIDVQQKMEEKLGKKMEKYVILGACHPQTAYEVIQHEVEIGLMLPCNIIVYKKEGNVHVSAIRPSAMMKFVDNPRVAQLGIDIEQSLEKVISLM